MNQDELTHDYANRIAFLLLVYDEDAVLKELEALCAAAERDGVEDRHLGAAIRFELERSERGRAIIQRWFEEEYLSIVQRW